MTGAAFDAAGLDAELERGAQALGVTLDTHQRRQLLQHLALIEQWNRVYNLTAVRDPAAMLVQHLLDSLALVPTLRRQTGGRSRSVLDVGSGAGLPGVALAVACPELNVTCVDAVAKKASFIRQAAAELGLSNLAAEHARVEDLTAGRWPLITARAFASLPDLVRLTHAQLEAGGVWGAMKGHIPKDEIENLPRFVEVFHVEHLKVPGLNAQRCVVWMRAQVELS